MSPSEIRSHVAGQLAIAGVVPTNASILLRAAQILRWLRESPSLATQPDIDDYTQFLLQERSNALTEYNIAVESDGVSVVTWDRIADDLAAAADAIRVSGAFLESTFEYMRARAVDAAHRAQHGLRMVQAARRQWGATCIEVQS